MCCAFKYEVARSNPCRGGRISVGAKCKNARVPYIWGHAKEPLMVKINFESPSVPHNNSWFLHVKHLNSIQAKNSLIQTPNNNSDTDNLVMLDNLDCSLAPPLIPKSKDDENF